MPRQWVACFAVLVAFAACGRLKPLSPDGSSGADQGSPAPGDLTPDSSVTIVDAGSDGERLPDGATADALLGAVDALVGSDGGRVAYRAIAVATGEDHACALLDDHRVKCWGFNVPGQLGYGDTRTRGASASEMGDALPTVDLGTGRTALAIAASYFATCAILDDGSMKCWGLWGLSGQPHMNGGAGIGDEPGEMGDNLPALDFGGRRAVNVAMGEGLACASMDDDSIWCWAAETGPGGANTPWQWTGLPRKRVRMLSPMNRAVVALYDDGTLSPPLSFGGALPVMFTSDRKIVAVTGGWTSDTCVLFDDATTACLESQLSSGPQSSGPANVAAIGAERGIGHGLCVARTDGDVQCDGQKCAPPFQCSSDGSFTFGASALAVTCNGSTFACALLADGNIKCWDDSTSFPTPPALRFPPRAALGAAFDITTGPDGALVYGPWHAVDLGTH
jgi:hypothetical protein